MSEYVVDILFQAGEIESRLASSPTYALTKLNHIILPSNHDLWLIAYVVADPSFTMLIGIDRPPSCHTGIVLH